MSGFLQFYLQSLFTKFIENNDENDVIDCVLCLISFHEPEKVRRIFCSGAWVLQLVFLLDLVGFLKSIELCSIFFVFGKQISFF